MTVLVWDQIADRRYEVGVERGVLYPLEGPAVTWNGLVSVNEIRTRDVKSYYIDGMKYLDHVVPGAYEAKISAVTYPSVLDELTGIAQYAPGVNVHDQRSGMFHLSYRTLIGDVNDGPDHGYKLHLIYNLTAIMGDPTYGTMSDKVDPIAFDWTVKGAQTLMWGIRPTNHLSFDSTSIHPDVLAFVEDQVYGTADTDPVMPDLIELLTAIEAMS